MHEFPIFLRVASCRAEELDRVVPLAKAIHAASDVVISVDTHRAEVARQYIEAGAKRHQRYERTA